MAVDSKTDINQNGVQIIKTRLEYESKPIIYFWFLRIFTLSSKDQKQNMNCTMLDVWGDVLRRPHCTPPAAVKAVSFKSNENIHKKEDGSYDVV